MPGLFRKEFCITNSDTDLSVILIYHLLYYKIQSVVIINQYRQQSCRLLNGRLTMAYGTGILAGYDNAIQSRNINKRKEQQEKGNKRIADNFRRERNLNKNCIHRIIATSPEISEANHCVSLQKQPERDQKPFTFSRNTTTIFRNTGSASIYETTFSTHVHSATSRAGVYTRASGDFRLLCSPLHLRYVKHCA